MPTEPLPPTLSAIADRAADVVDPEGKNDGVAKLVERHEDRDEPVTAVSLLAGELAEEAGRVDPQEEDPEVQMMVAVILHLAHRRDEVGMDRLRILEQAARDEFGGQPPAGIRDWLSAQGVGS